MRKSLWLLGLLLALSANARGETSNILFAFPHLSPSPLTLPAGRLLLGTQVSYGVTDFLQLQTDLLRDLYGFYNAGVKLQIWDTELAAVALTLGFETYNPNDFCASCSSVQITSWQPGVAVALLAIDRLAWFGAANLNYQKFDVTLAEGTSHSSIRGARLSSDLAWAYHPPTQKRDISNVLAAGVSYDFSYGLFGIGLSHHWPGFQVGFHYYPNADQRKILPILVGGMGLQL